MQSLYFFGFFLGSMTVTFAAGTNSLGCLEKEKALTLLETAENLLTKATEFFPSCREEINTTDQSECGTKRSLAYIEITKKLISDVKENFPTCSKPIEKDHKDKDDKVKDVKYRDCSEIFRKTGRKENGVYTIWTKQPDEYAKPLEVYCDMQTDDGGWTVIQRRGKFPVQQDFQKDWEGYKNGFGNLSEEFWLGNENIRVLCLNGCKIRFDLQDEKGKKGFAQYLNFKLTGSNYHLAIYGYTGNVGDGMKYHNDNDFSTKDKGDTKGAKNFKGGWWHGLFTGYECNLNGIYQPATKNYETVGWFRWREQVNLASVEIKIRPN